MKTIAVHLASGFEEIEAITIIDVLRRAGLDVITVSISNETIVTGSHGVPVIADKLYEDISYEEVDMIILPGGMPGSKNLDQHQGLKEQILLFQKNNKPLGAICAAPMVLGHLKILDGKKAVCYPGFEDELSGASVLSIPAVIDGTIVTGRGVGAALSFSLKIVEMLLGKEKADKLASGMLVQDWE